VVSAGRDGAFSVNRAGLQGNAPFPLSFSVRDADGSWMTRGSAAAAAELAGVLAAGPAGTIIVADLATNSFLDEDYAQWPPSRIAAAQGVRCQARSLGPLASGVTGLSEEMIAIGTAAAGEPVLPGLPGARMLYSGHDDCYFAVEPPDPPVPAALLGRLLALLAGSALAGQPPAGVAEPDDALTAGLLADSAHWTGALGGVSGHMVTVRLAAADEPWRPGRQLPERADRLAICDTGQGSWRLTPARAS
jgi:hypothetical protein